MFTVLVEGDDMDEPISDAVRSILDGHIVLSRRLSHRNHYPAIDVLESISRCMPEVISEEHLACAGRIKDLMAAYRENEDLIQIGAYAQGTNERIDRAIRINAALESFLRQSNKDKCSFEASVAQLKELEAAAGVRKA